VKIRIGILGIGDVRSYLLEEACRTVLACFEAECSYEGFEPLRQEFFDPQRKQHLAEPLLRYVSFKAKDRILLGLVDGDAYAGKLNFVFGIASPAGGTALVFLPRLRPEFYGGSSDRQLLLSRLRKEVLHELGHVFGLEHCTNKCVMRFSNSIDEVDEKPAGFCRSCAEKLRRIGIDVSCLAGGSRGG
jgi:archaemetzincin